MRRGLGRLAGPPLIVQLIGLLIGALVAAQLVTLLLTLVLPPPPPRAYRLEDIAASLAGRVRDDDRFDRVVEPGPPDLSAPGWFVSQGAQARLAGLLRQPTDRVRLGFFTQLPVGGTVGPMEPLAPPKAARARPAALLSANLIPEATRAEGTIEIAFSGGSDRARMLDAALIQQMPGAPPGGGFPGGGPPGAGFPGGGLPGGGFPQSLPRPLPRVPQPSIQPPRAQQTSPGPSIQAPSPTAQPVAGQGAQSARPSGTDLPVPSPVPAQDVGALRGTGQPPTFPGPVPPAAAAASPLFGMRGLPPRPDDALRAPPRSAPRSAPVDTPSPPSARADRQMMSSAASIGGAAAPTGTPAAGSTRPATDAVGPRQTDPPAAAEPYGVPVPIARVRSPTGLFGLAPAPFVEGDFAAAVRLGNGRWAVLSPRAEGFPTMWQRRVALWFLLSLLAVAPVAWLFAQRIVGPLDDFAQAADRLGRDPGAAVLPLAGPAEIGRAAHAFNQMQSRLRSFVDDRTAMIGAISHDLRTPLTRLRFRIEDVPDDQQDGLRGEVDEMEAMISSVISFLRDASVPNARERRDLAEVVDDVVQNAGILGDVRAERMESAIVDIDPLGIRRVLDNLLTNAIKYGGGQARVALRVEAERAVADIVDRGPGVPESELERVFEPFYRSTAARSSGREGSGLGLAVCRSIARAHGGDVALFRSQAGFTARVTLPLAFAGERRAA